MNTIKESINKIPEGLPVSYLLIKNSLLTLFELYLKYFAVEIDQVTGDEASRFVEDIGADKVEFKFKKPKEIEIGGSYSMQCVAKPVINVDLFLQLPKVN